MLWMISKFIFCLLAAGVLGFIAGWILSSLIKNEQSEEKFYKLKDDFDTKRAELNQAYSDLDAQDREITLLNNNMDQTRKELLMKNMDLEEYEKNGFLTQSTGDLELENNTLKEEISEYKYLENENELLHNEITALSMEKEKLLQEVQKNQEYMANFSSKKDKVSIRKLDADHVSILEKDLKRAKNKIKHMQQVLKDMDKKVAKPIKRKKEKKENEINIFDFQKESNQRKKKKIQNK